MVIIDDDDYLSHYGTPRHSGRYPWGSGGDQPDSTHRNMSLLDHISEQRKQGLKDTEIAAGMGLSTTQLRAQYSIALAAKKQHDISMAQSLKDKNYSDVEGAKRMGIPGSTYRTLLAPGAKERADNITNVSDMLKKEVAEKKYVDIGSGVENHLGVSAEKLRASAAMLQAEGYTVHNVPIPQQSTAFDTKTKVLAAPGTTQKEVWENRDQIKQITKFSPDGGRSFGQIHPPIVVDPNRLTIRYKEDGGGEADGVIFVRPGVPDLSLGKSMYAQVRVQVGDGHYLKGMAMYKDDLPDGTDLLFNTPKPRTPNKLDALKPIGSDKDYPFGAIVHQITAETGTPKEHVTSAMNIVNEEGDWGKWSKTLSSQFLSKQNPSLAKTQLDKTFERRKKDFEEINALTNPTVKKKLLEDFASDSDAAAVHLKAATFQGAAWHAILPIESMKPTEIHAPNYTDGEHVALIRYPHGGTFEIPELVVNNKNREARRLLGNAKDAVGIHHTVAERLSGADFDGDTVLVIRNNAHRVKSSPSLEGLKNFDPIAEYPGYEGMPKINKGLEMGKISNLITDMTLKGAPHSELVRAIRHSMVVIDAEKKNLNYRESASKNGIAALKAKYQGRGNAGAATLISRKKSIDRVPDRKARLQGQGGPIDPVTGRRVFVNTNRTVRNKDGERVLKMVVVKKLAETDNAHTLVSSPHGTQVEKYYADHSNRLKELANQARLTASKTPGIKYSSSANKAYAKEAASLNSKLALVQSNRPRERQAQITSSASIKAKLQANPNLDKDSIKKIKFKELEIARARAGIKKTKIEITPEEWNAIQAGAISDNKLTQILKKADMEIVRKHATPRRQILMSPSNTARANAMLRSGATRAEVAAQLGVSLTTLDLATTKP